MFSPFSHLKMEIYGASHAEKIGVKISNLPIGENIDLKNIQEFVDRRKATNSPWSTPRKEEDKVIFLKGIDNGKITDDIEACIFNENKKSSDYLPYKNTPRPSHADFVAICKDKENVDLAGGGRFSGRMTAPICIAGSIAKQLLSKKGIKVIGYTKRIGNVESIGYGDTQITEDNISNNPPYALTNNELMIEEVIKARDNNDSVGGQIECLVLNTPIGLGDNLFDGLESRISALLFGIPAVKAVEFGLGTKFANSLGSVVNDPFMYDKNGKIVTKTNNNGGINGGISNGMPIAVRVTFKPTPSISKEQDSVNLETKENTKIIIKGRHDACIVPRAIPVVESCLALAILDCMLENE